MTDLGQMTERLTIQSVSTTLDAGGGQGTPVWAAIANQPGGAVWGAVKPLRGDEQILAGQMDAPFSHKIAIHWRDDVSPEMRLVWGNKILNIRSVQDPNPGFRRELEIMAEEGVMT